MTALRMVTLAMALLVGGLAAPTALAQTGGAAAPATPAPPAEPWTARCTAADRTQTPDCVMEQRIIVTQTRQLLTGVTIRQPAEAAAPVMMIQTPLGLFLPAGLKLAVDGAPLATLPLQTCDTNGCFAGNAVSPELLTAMQRGTTMTVTFQNLQKKDINVPVSLVGFTTAYNKIH
jgi:invasion protein IalB